MRFVIDASVTACWILPDETNALADAARRSLLTDSAVVPAIWWFEVRNLLLMAERRNRLDAVNSQRALDLLRILPILPDDEPGEGSMLALARKHGLTVYDAAYLELAQRLRIPLATLDEQLSKAARREHVPLFTA